MAELVSKHYEYNDGLAEAHLMIFLLVGSIILIFIKSEAVVRLVKSATVFILTQDYAVLCLSRKKYLLLL